VTGSLTHTQLVAALHDGQIYTYYVRCRDAAGSTNSDDYAINFYIHSADAMPPIISNVQVTQLTPYSAIVTWDTDEVATSQVEYGATSAYGKFTILNAARAITHAVTLRGLDPATAYHFRVRSIDIGDNESISADAVFTTTALSSLHYVNQKHLQASDSNPGTEAQPWLTIQHAADVAQPGDTIIVYPGSYGRTTIHKGGTAGNYITYKGLNVPDRSLVDPNAVFDPHHPVQIPGNPSVNAVTKGFSLVPTYPSTVTIGYVRIENFEITRIGDASGRGGFQLQNTESVEMVRNLIHDLNPNPAGYDYIGIRGESHDNVNTLVKDNTLYRVQGTGINIVGKNWIVEGNEVSHSLDANTDTGLEVGGDSDAVRFFGSGHVIRNNTLHDNLDTEQYGSPHIDCFQTFSVWPDSQFAYDILIEGNTCDRMGQMLMIEDSSETNGTGNKVHHITFRNNVFRRARAFAFNGGMADHFTFVNNVVAESTYGGFGLTKTPYLTVVNNIFYNNGSGSQINDNESKVGSVWDYNIHYPDFSWPPKQPEYDQHSLFGVEPGFLNSTTGDYDLRVDSPAIDRGMLLGEFNYDKIATSRPQIAAWDIGAYEAIPEVALYGAPANQAIYLAWQINTPLPVTSTWRIDYASGTGTAYLPITGIVSSTRAYSLTGLTNYTWYTVTLSAMLDSTPFLSDTVRVMPTDRLVYLPLVTH
jgi:Purple acid Phosphatase, N-terminal domain